MRKHRFSYSKRALRDIAGIYNYILQDNPSAARRLVALLENKVISLARTGNVGVSPEWLAPGLRAFPIAIDVSISGSRIMRCG